MTAHPIDRDWDRLDALVDTDPIALRDAAWRLVTALAAAEHRATRAEAQSAIRGRAVAIHRQRAREAEARVKAVGDVLDNVETGRSWFRPVDFSGTPFPLNVDTADIRRALGGTDTPTDAG